MAHGSVSPKACQCELILVRTELLTHPECVSEKQRAHSTGTPAASSAAAAAAACGDMRGPFLRLPPPPPPPPLPPSSPQLSTRSLKTSHASAGWSEDCGCSEGCACCCASCCCCAAKSESAAGCCDSLPAPLSAGGCGSRKRFGILKYLCACSDVPWRH